MTRPDTEKLAGLLALVPKGEVWEVEQDPYDSDFPGICLAGSPFEIASFTAGEDASENQARANLAIAAVNALPALLSHILTLEETIAGEPGRERVREAFTYAFASGYRYADETSRSCMSAMDDAWEEFSAIRNEGLGV